MEDYENNDEENTNLADEIHALKESEQNYNNKLREIQEDIKKDEIMASETLEKIVILSEEVIKEKVVLEGDLNAFIKSFKEWHTKLEPTLSEYQVQEQYYLYLIVLQQIDELSSSVKAALVVKAYDQALKFLLEIAELYNRLVAGKTEFSNLLTYVMDTLAFWYGILFQQLLGIFEETATIFGWPMISLNGTKSNKTKSQDLKEVNHQSLQQLEHTLRLILRLPIFTEPSWMKGRKSDGKKEVFKLSSDSSSHLSASNDIFFIEGIQNVTPLAQILLVPFYKRFKYHFTGPRKTNQINKPEWYFSQLLEWIKLNSPFLYTVIQPILDKSDNDLDIQADFIKGTIYIAKEKLRHDLPLLTASDEDTFTHTIDETFIFHRSLALYGYELSVPSCVEMFCESQFFNRWITAEHTSATEKVNDFLLSPNAWVCEVVAKQGVKEKVPQFVEKYTILLEYLNDRYEYIPYPLKKIQFSAVQIELLDDFRIRLLQILREKKLDQSTYGEIRENFEPYCYILNSFDFIIKTLTKWKDMPTFVHIGYIKSKYSKFIAQKRRTPDTSSFGTAISPNTHESDVTSPCDIKMDLGSVLSILESALHKLDPGDQLGNNVETDGLKEEKEEKMGAEVSNADPEEKEFYDTVLKEQDLLEVEGSDYDIFADTIELYWMARADTLNHLIDCAKALCHLKLKPYKNQKVINRVVLFYKISRWNALPPKTYFISMELSSLACDVLSFVKELLFLLKKYLTADIYKKFMIKLTKDIDDYMFQEVILSNHFNDGGAHQLQYDINKGFMSVFALHTSIPENLFKKSLDASLILNLNQGTALLLKESLIELSNAVGEKSSVAADLVNVRKQKEALTDLGIRVLDIDRVVEILDLRSYGGRR